MPNSFLSRHRTICDVLEEIRTKTVGIGQLIDEAKDYAQRMSAKLAEYKNERSSS